MDGSFESRVWTKALERGLITTGQINQCLRDFRAESPTLLLTEILLAKGWLKPGQVAELRGEVATADPVPDDVRIAARDPKNLLGRFVLLGELGRGGMGVVHKAWDADLRRGVALKVLSGPWQKEDLERFRREARTAAALRHPNIITVYEIGPSDENPYIALELIEGATLHGRKLPSRKAAELMVTIARAVEAAHRAGIIHRDLKPANIMIDAEGRPRVMDFGLAKPEVSSSQITMDGTIVGTPAYMSPEQAQGRIQEIDHRSDVYSLGALLYELLTGQAPFRGDTPLETLTAVVGRPPVPPRRILSSIPKPLEAVVLTCLRKKREQRYQTAEELALDLERFLKGEPVQAKVPRPRTLYIVMGSALAAFAIAAILLIPSTPPPAPVPVPVKAKPGSNDLQRGLRLLEESRRDLYRAGAKLDQTLTRLKEAERCFDAAIAADPALGEAYLARADAKTRQNRIDASLRDYAEAIKRLPTSPAALLARGHVLLDRYMDACATASWMRGDLPDELLADRDQARADFQKARKLSPSKNELAFLQLCLDVADERFEEAITAATELAGSAERPEIVWRLRGDAHAMHASNQGLPGAGQVAEMVAAVEDYGKAISLCVNYTDAYRRRGAALWLLGRGDESIRDFQSVLAMNDKDSLALGDLGTIYVHSGKPGLALPYYDRAIEADPDNLRARTNRGSVHLQAGRLKEARIDLERAVELNPHHLAALFNLSAALLKLGDRAGAIQRSTEILEKRPTFASPFAIRGRAHAELGHWKEGLADCEQAVKLDAALEEQLKQTMDVCRQRLDRR